MKLASATAVTDLRLGLDVERLFSGDPTFSRRRHRSIDRSFSSRSRDRCVKGFVLASRWLAWPAGSERETPNRR